MQARRMPLDDGVAVLRRYTTRARKERAGGAIVLLLPLLPRYKAVGTDTPSGTVVEQLRATASNLKSHSLETAPPKAEPATGRHPVVPY